MFQKLFSTENPVWQAMDKMGDIMILNFLFMLFSLPVFTAGAAMTALYTVCFKMLNETEGNIIKTFFKAFKSNFKQATIIWVGMMAVIVFLAYDFMIAYTGTTILSKIFMGLVILVAIVFSMWASWIFPVLSKFDNPVRTNVKNAALMMVIHMFPTTLLITLLNVVPLLLLWFQTPLFFWLLPFFFFFMFSLVAYNNSKQLKKAFGDYIQEEDPINTDEC